MFVKHGRPRRQQSQNITKISKSYIWPPPTPRGMECQWSVRNPSVQVWLLYLHPNFYYWTFFVSGTELRTDDRQTDGQTYNPITRCPRRTFQAGDIKRTRTISISNNFKITTVYCKFDLEYDLIFIWAVNYFVPLFYQDRLHTQTCKGINRLDFKHILSILLLFICFRIFCSLDASM